MKQGKTGWLWQAGDRVFVSRIMLPVHVRRIDRLYDAGRGYCVGEVVTVRDDVQRVQIALQIKGQSFVIGVGPMPPTALMEPHRLDDLQSEKPGALPSEQFLHAAWIDERFTHRVRMAKDITTPHGLTILKAGETYDAYIANEPAWDSYGYNVFCPLTRREQFVELSCLDPTGVWTREAP